MDEQSRPPKRTIVLPPKFQKPEAVRVESAPQLSTLLEDALSVYQTEIIKFRNKVNSGKSLDLAEARVLQGYVKSLVDAAREMRERNKDDDELQENLSDEQMLEATKIAMAGLEAKVAAKKKLGASS